MRESTAEKIPLDIHYPIFLMFLEFLYTDDVDFAKVGFRPPQSQSVALSWYLQYDRRYRPTT